MEIVGILLARIYLQRLKNYPVVIHIKNHNLCIILILSFLLGILVSYLQRRIKCVFKNCGYPESWRGGKAPPPEALAGAPSPLSPVRGGVWGNQSCN